MTEKSVQAGEGSASRASSTPQAKGDELPLLSVDTTAGEEEDDEEEDVELMDHPMPTDK